MPSPPRSPQGAGRTADLQSYEILDAPPDPAFDRIARLAALACGTQRAAITLVDRDRLWFRGRYGTGVDDMSLADSICAHAMAQDAFFEVVDTRSDPRFAHNRVLQEAGVRFYGGSRLVNPRGETLGMLCVHDSEPKSLDAQQREALDHLATVVVSLMEAHRRGRRLAWFGRLIDEVSDEIFIADAGTWRYLHVNQTGLDQIGYTLEQLKTMTPLDVTPSLMPEQFRSFVERLQSGERVVTYEGVRRRADGSTYDVEVRLHLVSSSHRPVLVSQVRDITERKAIARLKDEFVSVVSHELRTPLTAIHGALRLLESGAVGGLPEGAARLVSIAAQGSGRLRSIVDDILDLEQIAAGRMTFEIAPLDAAAILRQVAAAFEAQASDAGLSFALDAAPSLRFLGDERRVQQVVGNLVSNALKFAPPGSTVELAAKAHDGAVRICVTDHGPGIPDAFRGRIFQRFSQADMGSARAVGGSGLGLSIVKRMSEQMDGRVGFESRPGLTRFHIDLPAA